MSLLTSEQTEKIIENTVLLLKTWIVVGQKLADLIQDVRKEFPNRYLHDSRSFGTKLEDMIERIGRR